MTIRIIELSSQIFTSFIVCHIFIRKIKQTQMSIFHHIHIANSSVKAHWMKMLNWLENMNFISSYIHYKYVCILHKYMHAFIGKGVESSKQLTSRRVQSQYKLYNSIFHFTQFYNKPFVKVLSDSKWKLSFHANCLR